jgi:hypothetical protein
MLIPIFGSAGRSTWVPVIDRLSHFIIDEWLLPFAENKGGISLITPEHDYSTGLWLERYRTEAWCTAMVSRGTLYQGVAS